MEQPQLEANMTVATVLTRWPQIIPVFLQYRMACVGCAIAPFETLAEVAVIYHLDLACFMGELQQAINGIVEAGEDQPASSFPGCSLPGPSGQR